MQKSENSEKCENLRIFSNFDIFKRRKYWLNMCIVRTSLDLSPGEDRSCISLDLTLGMIVVVLVWILPWGRS